MNRTKIFALAKGFRGRAKNCYNIARPRVEKALQYQYRDRRQKKRDVRQLWIAQVNAGARQYGTTYSRLLHGLVRANVKLNRKMLANLAVYEPSSFGAVVDTAVQALRVPN